MVDVATAEHHGICPKCEGYGGSDVECTNELCVGSCPMCWCPGCHDGNVDIPLPESEEKCGSWEAYAALHRGHPTGRRERVNQEVLDV